MPFYVCAEAKTVLFPNLRKKTWKESLYCGLTERETQKFRKLPNNLVCQTFYIIPKWKIKKRLYDKIELKWEELK